MQHLLQYLIASFLIASSSLSLGFRGDTYTYSGSESDLRRLFRVETEFSSDGLIGLHFERSGLGSFNDKQCSVGIYIRYLVQDKTGSALRTISHFKETEGFVFEVIDASQQYNGSIYLHFSAEKGACALDQDYSYVKSYFFAEGISNVARKE